MARKTNKTDHLLNLLAGSGGQEETQQEAVKAADAKETLKENKTGEAGEQKTEGGAAQTEAENAAQKEAATGTAPVYETGAVGKNVHVVRAIGSEDPIAELIKEELETDLNAAMEKAGAKEETVMARDTVQNEVEPIEPEAAVLDAAVTEEPAAEEMAVAEEDAVSEPEEAIAVQEEETAAGEVPAQEEPVGNAAEEEAEEEPIEELLEEVRGGTIEEHPEVLLQEEPVTQESDNDDDDMQGYVFHNMMETIVRDKVDEYIRQFGVCTCKHCKADVIALALSKLPPKYVVVHESAISPLRSFYEDHYAGQIVVEITKACIAVSSHPHHSR